MYNRVSKNHSSVSVNGAAATNNDRYIAILIANNIHSLHNRVSLLLNDLVHDIAVNDKKAFYMVNDNNDKLVLCVKIHSNVFIKPSNINIFKHTLPFLSIISNVKKLKGLESIKKDELENFHATLAQLEVNFIKDKGTKVYDKSHDTLQASHIAYDQYSPKQIMISLFDINKINFDVKNYQGIIEYSKSTISLAAKDCINENKAYLNNPDLDHLFIQCNETVERLYSNIYHDDYNFNLIQELQSTIEDIFTPANHTHFDDF